MTHRRRWALARLVICVPFALAACSTAENADDQSVLTSAATEVEETKGAAPDSDDDYTVVSPDGFSDPSGSLAQISTQLAGEAYFCALGAAVVSCTATAPDSVPNLEDMPGQPWGPFTGRPSAVSITGGDIEWGIIEGGPAGSGSLNAGERLEFGGSWCQVPDDQSIQCGSGGTSFTISGPNRTFSQP